LGIHEFLDLSHIGQIQYKYQLDNNMTEHELDKIVVTEVENIQWHQNPNEVMDVRWWDEQELVKLLNDKSDIFAAWFPKVFEHTRLKISERASLA
jgi:isopentenyl-diphosphate delta-isomerase